MYRIRMFMVAFAILAAILFTSVFATGAHAATKPSSPAVSHAAPHTVHPDANNVPCYLPHAVEIHNNTGTLCFNNPGHLSVRIYNVDSILHTGNDGHSETFYCNRYFLVELANPGDYWVGGCSVLTDIFL